MSILAGSDGTLDRAVVGRWLCLAATAALLGMAAAILIGNGALIRDHGAEDFEIYLRHTRTWLAGDGFYDPRQLTGQPYALVLGDSLYPPPFALVMLPFLVLPAVLWWVLPIATVAAVVRSYRPAPWTWPVMALCIASPRTLGLLVYGNPSMWLAASVALATVFGWPGVFAFLKPSLAFFAVIGIRTRGWWIAAGVLALVSVAMLPDFADYVIATVNLQGPNLTYSLMDIPLIAIAIVAWRGRTRSPSSVSDLRPY